MVKNLDVVTAKDVKDLLGKIPNDAQLRVYHEGLFESVDKEVIRIEALRQEEGDDDNHVTRIGYMTINGRTTPAVVSYRDIKKGKTYVLIPGQTEED